MIKTIIFGVLCCSIGFFTAWKTLVLPSEFGYQKLYDDADTVHIICDDYGENNKGALFIMSRPKSSDEVIDENGNRHFSYSFRGPNTKRFRIQSSYCSGTRTITSNLDLLIDSNNDGVKWSP